MRTLIVNTFLTLDGVMQAPGGPQEDPSGGFEHGGWSVNFWDEQMGAVMDEQMSEPFDLLLGRKTYEIFAAHWPKVDFEPGPLFNRITKYVASRTRDTLEWENSVLLDGDAGEAVARLKEEDGPDLQVHGSSDLIQTLLQRGLVDLLRLWVFPVVVGEGKCLFESGVPPKALRLIDSKTTSTGVVIAYYEPAGEIALGSFEL